MKNKALKTAIIAVIGLLVLPAIGLMLAKERTDIKSMAADLPAMPAMFVEEDDIMSYQTETPSFGEWSRAVSNAAAPRYKSTGDGSYEMITPSVPGTARIMCAGDMMCEPAMSRAVFLNNRFFFESCFAKVRQVFAASDFAIANLETSVDPDSPYAIDKHVMPDRYHCNAPVDYLDAVRYSGIDAVTMANNHTCDTGAIGLFHTIRNVEGNSLLRTGAFLSPQEKRYLLVDINGIKVAFFSYTQHFNSRLDEKCFTPQGREVMLNLYSREKMERDLAAAKADGAEYTIVYIHFWCKDYTHEVQDSQYECAREIAEAGADCIVGGHPHAVQPYDEIVTSTGKCVPVAYCLGNFITSDANPTTRTSYIFELFLERDAQGVIRLADKKVIPCCVIEFPEQSGYVVFPTPEKWRSGKTVEAIDEAEAYVMRYLGSMIEIDRNDA